MIGSLWKKVLAFCAAPLCCVLWIASDVHPQPRSGDSSGISVPAGLKRAGAFQPGDALKITVYPDTVAFPNGIYHIDSDGFVELPLVGLVRVTDFSIPQFEQLLNEKYVKFLPQPTLTIRPLVRISLLGGFQRPGLYWIDPRESIWAAVQMAGGTLREDGIRKIIWERDSGIVARNIQPFFQSGKSLSTLGFKSGDQLCVTPKPLLSSWDKFNTMVLPITNLIISTSYMIAMAYISFQVYNQQRH